MAAKTDSKAKRQAIVVLGMHRSGTSALSGVLALLGCDAPKTPMPASEANEKGFFESLPVYQLHKDILDSAGSIWADWQPVHEAWFSSTRAEEFRQRAGEVMEQEFGTSPLFVFKDPRVCRLVPFWLDTLKELKVEPLILHVHRNPLDVVSSLSRHHDLSKDTCLLLWLRHVLDAERHTRGMPRHFLSYARFLKNWGREMKRLQEGLDVTLPRQSSRVVAEVNNFLEGTLRHFDSAPQEVTEDPNVAEWIRSTYGILERWAKEGETTADHATLDRINKDFESATPILATVVANREHVRRKLNEARSTQADLRKCLADAEDQRTRAEKDRSAAQERIAKLEAEVTLLPETRAALKAAQEKGEAAKVEADRLTAAQAELRKQLEDQRTRAEKDRSAAQERIAKLEAEAARLPEVRADLDGLRQQLAANLETLQIAQTQAAQADEQRQGLTARLAETNASLEETRTRLTATENALSEERRLGRQAALDREAVENALALLRQEQSLVENRLRQREAELDQATQAQQEAQRALDRLQADHARALAERDQALSAQEGSVLRHEAAIGKLEESLKTRFEEIAKMTRMVTEAEATIEVERQSTRDVQAHLKGELGKVRAELSRAMTEAEKNAAIAAEQQQKIAALDHRLQETDQALASERAGREKAEYANMELQLSTSWRVTAPIRKISSLLRRRG